MKAAVFKGIKDIQVEEVPDPEAGPDDVVVEVSVCGICGSDLHTFLHGSFVEPGQVMGHEFSGRVVEAGPEVKDLSVGDRVTAVPIVPCGECARCAEGRYNLCGVAWTTGIAYGKPGAFAERVRIPHSVRGENVFALSDDVDDEAGATVEPLAVAVHAVNLIDGVQGATALVLGLGTIGQQVVQVLRAKGAERVIGVDISQLRIDAARELGAEALDGSPGIAEALGGVLGEGQEVDVVFECSGVPALAEAALDTVRGGGTIVVLALYDDPVTFNPTSLVQKELRLQGSIAYTSKDFAEAIELLRSGAARADALITQRERLDDIGEAFDVQLAKDRSLKVLVAPNGG
ncbi:MAG TPA: alcohol dehydrogenase catalytic domain-containing protein [Thermoleophilaceae bacterium]|jgi:(R,R)-butanediol dehydrogenase/meso-butanediol dehydrogenase/diacetyl reductase